MAITYLPYAQQSAAVERQRRLAEMLQQQASEPFEIQQTGRIAARVPSYAPLVKALQGLAAGYVSKKAGESEAALKERGQQEARDVLQQYVADLNPKTTTTQRLIEPTEARTPEEYQDIMNRQPQYGAAETPEDYQNLMNTRPTRAETTVTPGMNRQQALARILELKASGTPQVADMASNLTALLPKEVEIGAIDPTKYTPESLEKYKTTGKYDDLRLITKEADLPTSVDEYVWAVNNQGYKGTLADWQKQKAMNVNIPAPETYGALTVVTDPVTGKQTYVRPGSRGSIQQVPRYTPPPKPMTKEQATASGFASRIADSESTLSSGFVPSIKESAEADIPFLGNKLISDDTRAFKQAERNFINSTLRRESGAAISASEFDSARKQYIPQPGDDQKTLRMKAQNRQRVLESLRAESNAVPPSSEMPAGFEPYNP